MAWARKQDRWRMDAAVRPSHGIGVVPLNDILAFLGMCLLSAGVYGLACWLGRLL